MSISSALANAVSGLAAASRGAGIVSANVANAQTDGYGRRELDLASASNGMSGVRIVSVTRHMDRTVLEDLRHALADTGDQSVRAAFLDRLTEAQGVAGDGGSLADALAELEATLVEASARPESEQNLVAVADAADQLAGVLNDVSAVIQTERVRADQAIHTQVQTLNTALQRLEELNGQMARYAGDGDLAAGLLDERQQLVDQVASIVSVREIDRGNGRIALMTDNGTMLLDGSAAEIGFSRSPVITPYQTLDAGTLSGLTINGDPVDLNRSNHALSGGSLAGHLAVRDDLAVTAQAEMDAIARDLVERLHSADPTLAATDAGLLTDAGAAFDPADEVGLASRISINALVDPDAGGETWRIRDGLAAAAPGDEGQGQTLLAISAALSGERVISSGPLAGLQRSAETLLSDTLSGIGQRLSQIESRQAAASSRSDALELRLKEGGVDTDQEMQRLLLIEQAYAANAQVISTIETMMNRLMEAL